MWMILVWMSFRGEEPTFSLICKPELESEAAKETWKSSTCFEYKKYLTLSELAIKFLAKRRNYILLAFIYLDARF